MPAPAPSEVLQDTAHASWAPLNSGIEFRLLFSSGETGRWTVLFRCQPGSFIPRHKHYGAGEYFVITGLMQYRMGSASAGTYGYEPIGAIHDRTEFPEYTELLFTNYGPIAFLDQNDKVIQMLDYAIIEGLAASPKPPGRRVA